jgi:very-short-patch-repair endonuclease
MIERRLARHHLTPILRDRAHGMRADRASAEAKLWYFLCNRRLNGFRFRAHKMVGPFRADFYCFQAKLIIQLDQAPPTPAQTEWLNASGHRTMDVTVDDVNHNLIPILETILRVCCERVQMQENSN